MTRSWLWISLVLLVLGGCARADVRIGSKAFTESVILGDIAAHLIQSEGTSVRHVRDLGGTRVLWDALRAGQVDAYPEYTGTLRQELFADLSLPDDEASLKAELAKHDIAMTSPLGFNNSYAIGMRRERATALGIARISDLAEHPNLILGFSNEFLGRSDGWPGLRLRYQLPHQNVTGLDHTLAYQAVGNGTIDAVDVYVTDPHVEMYDLLVLEDDLEYFPRYDAVFLYRRDLSARVPIAVSMLTRLSGMISDARMAELNRRVEIDRVSELQAAAEFLSSDLNLAVHVDEPKLAERLSRTTLEHLWLVVVSLTAAILVSVPLGVVVAKRPLGGQVILGVAEVIQTIPGLALLVFMAVLFVSLGLPTIGPWPVIVALFLYSLLPIIRNTAAGFTAVPAALRESADALGLSPLARLRLVEFPLASPLILAGIKTTAVINIGYAALGGLIGAGGYGQPIMAGLRQNSVPMMMEGAIPAALLALAAKGFFSVVERWMVPRGLRLRG